MKKILALLLALVMVLALAACGGGSKAEEPAPAAEAPAAAPAEAPAEAPAAEPAGSYTVTFSTGETFTGTGDSFTFFFQCDAPGDMGAPNPGEEGAGITASEGTVSYSNVGLGGPFSYPTSELVTISGITGDITVTVTDAATAQDATHTIYVDDQEIADAIAFAEEMAAQMAANPMSGEPSGETSEEGEASGEPSGGMGDTEQDYEIELDGETVTAHYADVDNGDQMTKSFVITVNGNDVAGSIDKGEWVADSGDAADQAIVDAVHAAFDPSWAA